MPYFNILINNKESKIFGGYDMDLLSVSIVGATPVVNTQLLVTSMKKVEGVLQRAG